MGQIEPPRSPATQNRWFVVGAAIVLNVALGALYSWPVFANFLERQLSAGEQWTAVQTQLVFSMATVFLAVGVIVAGQLSERHEPRILVVLSAIFTGGGYLLGGLLPLTPVITTVTIGIMVGFGIGIAYALPISLAAKWFPDRKGLVTGLAMAGFGAGSVLWSQAFDLVLADRIGISLTFAIYGVVFATLILATMKFLRNPPEGYAHSLTFRTPKGIERLLSGNVEKKPGDRQNPSNFGRAQMVRHPQFYFLFYTLMVGSAIGLMIIGMSKTYPIERLVESGYALRFATNVTRVGALILFPVFNGFGRIAFGWLSDRIGWRAVMAGSYGLQALMLLVFPWLMSVPAMVAIALPLLAMCYGGNFTIFPVGTGQVWGSAHLAANYSLVFVAFGIGALVGPPLSGLAKDAGLIDTAFLISAALLATGAVLTALIRNPRSRGER